MKRKSDWISSAVNTVHTTTNGQPVKGVIGSEANKHNDAFSAGINFMGKMDVNSDPAGYSHGNTFIHHARMVSSSAVDITPEVYHPAHTCEDAGTFTRRKQCAGGGVEYGVLADVVEAKAVAPLNYWSQQKEATDKYISGDASQFLEEWSFRGMQQGNAGQRDAEESFKNLSMGRDWLPATTFNFDVGGIHLKGYPDQFSAHISDDNGDGGATAFAQQGDHLHWICGMRDKKGVVLGELKRLQASTKGVEDKEIELFSVNRPSDYYGRFTASVDPYVHVITPYISRSGQGVPQSILNNYDKGWFAKSMCSLKVFDSFYGGDDEAEIVSLCRASLRCVSHTDTTWKDALMNPQMRTIVFSVGI